MNDHQAELKLTESFDGNCRAFDVEKYREKLGSDRRKLDVTVS